MCGYDRTRLVDAAAYRDFVIEIVRRTDNEPGFKVLPRRWVWLRHNGGRRRGPVPGLIRGEVFATLHGELATIMEWTARQSVSGGKNTDTPGTGLAGVSVSVVAGAHNHRYRHSLRVAI